VGVKVGLESGRDRVGELGEQVGGAVAAVLQAEPGGAPGFGQLPVQLLAFGVLGDVWGDHLEDLVPESFELAGREVGGLRDQMRLGLGE